jgi:PAS domain S-box-containing protein
MKSGGRGAGGSDPAERAVSGREIDIHLQKLRRQGMERLRQRHPEIATMAAEDLASLVSELELHQAELEVQNEELRRTQAALADVRDRYRDLYEFAPVGYLTLDAQGLVRQINLAATRLCGLDRSGLIGRRIETLVAPADRDTCYLMLRRAIAGDHQSGEMRLIGVDGRVLWISAEVSSLPLGTDKPGGFRMTLTDITARKQAEEALRQANEGLEGKITERTKELEQTVGSLRAEVRQREAAEQALRQANSQLGNQAAQLRALAGELTLAEQRERRRLAKVLHDHFQQMLAATRLRVAILGRAGDRLIQAGAREIEQLLDECITTSRSLTAELSPPILQEGGLQPGLEWLARSMANRHGLKVSLAFEEGTPTLAEDVKVLLFESIQELLFNAVKHARVHAAGVDVRRIEDNMLQVTVSDAGQGFQPEKIKPAGEHGGGFGLFGIRERLKLFGGQMEIDSTVGHGSRFTLRVPVAAAPATVEPRVAPTEPAGIGHPAQATSPLPGAPIRVLLADDHLVMRQGLARLIGEEPDIEIVGEAADGQEAVELARRMRPDVILMDMSMPKVNGIDATRSIHHDLPDIHIIGLSMFDEADQAQAMRDAGAVAYLAKTGPSSEVIAAIRNCRSRSQGQ